MFRKSTVLFGFALLLAATGCVPAEHYLVAHDPLASVNNHARETHVCPDCGLAQGSPAHRGWRQTGEMPAERSVLTGRMSAVNEARITQDIARYESRVRERMRGRRSAPRQPRRHAGLMREPRATIAIAALSSREVARRMQRVELFDPAADKPHPEARTPSRTAASDTDRPPRESLAKWFDVQPPISGAGSPKAIVRFEVASLSSTRTPVVAKRIARAKRSPARVRLIHGSPVDRLERHGGGNAAAARVSIESRDPVTMVAGREPRVAPAKKSLGLRHWINVGVDKDVASSASPIAQSGAGRRQGETLLEVFQRELDK